MLNNLQIMIYNLGKLHLDLEVGFGYFSLLLILILGYFLLHPSLFAYWLLSFLGLQPLESKHLLRIPKSHFKSVNEYEKC